MNDFNFDEVMHEIYKGNDEKVRRAAAEAAVNAVAMVREASEMAGDSMSLSDAAKKILSMNEQNPFPSLDNKSLDKRTFLRMFFELFPPEILERGSEVTRQVEGQFTKRQLEIKDASWFSLF